MAGRRRARFAARARARDGRGPRAARQLASAGAPITTAQATTAVRQPKAAAMGGSTSAEMTPPTVSPICLIPIATPRSRTGKRSTMALPSTGLTTLQPTPARKMQAR